MVKFQRLPVLEVSITNIGTDKDHQDIAEKLNDFKSTLYHSILIIQTFYFRTQIVERLHDVSKVNRQ